MVSETKQLLLKNIVHDLQTYPIIGMVNMSALPAPQLQKMRSLLATKEVKIIMARKKILELAISQVKKSGLEQLGSMAKGMPALILSKNNPFELQKILQKNKSEAPAKGGQIAPKDIIVKAGATNFAPGPIISELAAVGIKTKVENGKLAIMTDATVAKEGSVISPKLAETLKRLDIKPMEIGLNLVAVWENGMIFEAKHLMIDEDEYLRNITQAAQWAMNLAIECAYLTEETTELLIQKAFRESEAVGIESNFINKETLKDNN